MSGRNREQPGQAGRVVQDPLPGGAHVRMTRVVGEAVPEGEPNQHVARALLRWSSTLTRR
jgi:hypothetical protein